MYIGMYTYIYVYIYIHIHIRFTLNPNCFLVQHGDASGFEPYLRHSNYRLTRATFDRCYVMGVVLCVVVCGAVLVVCLCV